MSIDLDQNVKEASALHIDHLLEEARQAWPLSLKQTDQGKIQHEVDSDRRKSGLCP